jgi:hypothetical protein
MNKRYLEDFAVGQTPGSVATTTGKPIADRDVNQACRLRAEIAAYAPNGPRSRDPGRS